jgi:hypothetical protein
MATAVEKRILMVVWFFGELEETGDGGIRRYRVESVG